MRMNASFMHIKVLRHTMENVSFALSHNSDILQLKMFFLRSDILRLKMLFLRGDILQLKMLLGDNFKLKILFS